MENYNNGYNTYVIGTSSNASNGLEILLYNRLDWIDSSPKLPKISLYNINEVYRELINNESNKYIILNRDNSEDPYIYKSDNGRINGFSIIIYISLIDNNPIGYTEFLSVQGIDNNLNIYTSFNSNISNFINVKLNNSLGQLRNNSTTGKVFSDNELIYKYTSPNTIIDEIKLSPKSSKFTSHVYSVLENKNMNIITDYGMLNSEIGARKLTLNSNINIDPYNHNYENHQLGFYGKDIVIYSWSGNKYSIKSLIKRTRFGNPESYTTGSGPDFSIIDTLGDNRNIFYFAGRYAVTSTTGYSPKLELYDTERNIWISTKYSNFYIDVLDPRCKIVSVPNSINSNEISNYIPDIKSIFLDLSEFSKFTNISIIKKIGDWYVLRNRISSIQDFYTYSCIDKTVHILKGKENPLVINNSLLMLHTIDEELGLDYYTIYYEPKIEYYTERARAAMNNSKLELDDELGILFLDKGDEESNKYRDYYRTGKIKIIHSSQGIFGNIFSGFRRGYYNDELSKSIPNIIASMYGFLYYINSDKDLNYI